MRSIDSSTGNLARGMRALLAGTAISAAATLPAAAQNANWLAAPGTGDFNTAANWSAGVPTGVAVFNGSTITALSFSADTTVGAWSFGSPANYTFTNAHTLTFNGVGIAVSAGSVILTNNAASSLFFNGSSTAGTAG